MNIEERVLALVEKNPGMPLLSLCVLLRDTSTSSVEVHAAIRELLAQGKLEERTFRTRLGHPFSRYFLVHEESV